jgi:group II intron reverse transcriptase/maturase
MNNSQLHYVVDIDIKGFFDNVNHGKLLKQMWNMGIQDKNLLSVIGRILKSEIRGIGIPNKGVPQGGLISPLLSNIALNELDWWLSNQWETKETRHCYSGRHLHRALKTTNLKELFFIRYADDFKILCRDYETAKKIYTATKDWLKERLRLEVSPEKSKITNVRKGKTEFLGIAIKVKENEQKAKFTARSNISDKAKVAILLKLKKQIIAIQRDTTPNQVNRLNSVILGIHNYYSMATMCSGDFAEINYIVSRSLYNRLRNKTKRVRKGWRQKKPESEPKPSKSRTYQKFYGKYDGKPKVIAGITIFPIYGCTHNAPMCFTQETNNYTAHGRQLVHKNIKSVTHLVRYLINCKEYGKSVQYNDNRISLIAGQGGKCFITGEALVIGNMQCHHKRPKEKGGTDEYKNLVWLCKEAHILIHATELDTINKYLCLLNLDEKALKKVNSLRLLAENLEINKVM